MERRMLFLTIAATSRVRDYDVRPPVELIWTNEQFFLVVSLK